MGQRVQLDSLKEKGNEALWDKVHIREERVRGRERGRERERDRERDRGRERERKI